MVSWNQNECIISIFSLVKSINLSVLHVIDYISSLLGYSRCFSELIALAVMCLGKLNVHEIAELFFFYFKEKY